MASAPDELKRPRVDEGESAPADDAEFWRKAEEVAAAAEANYRALFAPKTLVTGGAEGADEQWAIRALTAGWTVRVRSFAGHSARCVPGSDLVMGEVAGEAGEAVAARLRAIGQRMGRPGVPASGFTFQLLARNLAIADEADTLFAVGELKGEGGLGIAGGTAWACEAFFARVVAAAAGGATATPRMFFFDMITDMWMTPRVSRARPSDIGWTLLHKTPEIPRAAQRVAAVGSRKLTHKGKVAIEDVFYAWTVRARAAGWSVPTGVSGGGG